jgi:hypothetical protein
VSDEPSGFDLPAAALRANDAELSLSVEVLADKLERALPSATRVRRRRRGLLAREQRVSAIEVELGGTQLQLLVDGSGHVEAARGRRVGGIAIKREQLDLAGFLAALREELTAQAQRSAEARSALAELLS